MLPSPGITTNADDRALTDRMSARRILVVEDNLDAVHTLAELTAVAALADVFGFLTILLIDIRIIPYAREPRTE